MRKCLILKKCLLMVLDEKKSPKGVTILYFFKYNIYEIYEILALKL